MVQQVDTHRLGSAGSRGRAALAYALLAGLLAVYEAGLLTDFTYDLFRHDLYGLTFNSMLEHMLRGRFDVDPDIIGREGFRFEGRIYAYFGPFCALLRLPLLLHPGGLGLDVTVASSAAALLVAGLGKAASVRLLWRRANPGTSGIASAFLAYALLGGPLISFARPSIYQEVTLWSYALATVFLFTALGGLLRDRWSTGRLCTLAALAGAAFLTRASLGAGLLLATALLLLAVLATRPGWHERLRFAGSARFLLPSLVALALFAAALAVNQARWHDPFVTMPTKYYVFYDDLPAEQARSMAMPLFAPYRIPYAALYYFFPIWPLLSPGSALRDAYQTAFLAVELPPASFLATDLFTVVTIVLALAPRRRRVRPPFPPTQAVALGFGLALPAGLMLMSFYLAHRYRLDIDPLLDFACLLAFAHLSASAAPARVSGSAQRIVWAATLVSIVSAHVVLLLYKLSDYGSGYTALNGLDLFHYYYWRLRYLF